jgi:RimJ/RimL family protein N-acetyltransferase
MSERRNKYDQPLGAPVAGWSERSRPPRSALRGRYCRLEPVDPERHAADLFAAYMSAPDARDWTYLFAERPETMPSFEEYLATLAKSEDPLHFAIVDAESAIAVGTAALMRIDPAHGVIEVGSIAYSPRIKRTRAGTEAMYLLMRLVFDDLGYRRYEWKCDSLNGPSRAAAQRYGFTFEGIFRRAIVYKGRNRDTAWYSIIAEEWPRIRSAFDAWLDPQNFGEDGRQKRALKAMLPTL